MNDTSHREAGETNTESGSAAFFYFIFLQLTPYDALKHYFKLESVS